MAAINPFALTGYVVEIETLNGSNFDEPHDFGGVHLKTIRGAIPHEDNAKSFMSKVQEQFVGPTKSLADTHMTKLLNIKYDGHSSIRDHIFILNSLPAQYDHFKLVYNTHKKKVELNQSKLELADLAETSLGKKGPL
ncbi:hypothetical protein AMTRI_Chr08g162750 [Amborella trichopoda]